MTTRRGKILPLRLTANQTQMIIYSLGLAQNTCPTTEEHYAIKFFREDLLAKYREIFGE